MKKVNRLILLLLFLWAGTAKIYWSMVPHLATYSTPEVNSSVSQVIHGTTLIGIDVFVLLLGSFINRSKQHTEELLVKLWLVTFVVGNTLWLIFSFGTTYLSSSQIYDSLFPILRNSYPFITGIFFGIIAYKIVDKLPISYQKLALNCVVLLITLPFFFSVDIWGQNTTLFYILLFLIGGKGYELYGTKLSASKWLILGLTSYILASVLQFLMPFFANGAATYGRYTNTSNVLVVVTAFTIMVGIRRYTKRIPLWMLLVYLVFIENTAFLKVLATLADKKFGHSTYTLGLITFIFILGISALSILIVSLRKVKVVKLVSQLIQHFTSQTLDQQRLLLKEEFSKNKATIFQLALAILLSIVSLVLMNNSLTIEPYMGANYNVFVYVLGQRQLIIFLNALVIFATEKFIQAITRRYWISLFVTVLLNTILIVANRMKIAARSEPVLPSDLAMLKAGKQLFGMVDPKVWVISILTMLVVIVITTLLERKRAVLFHWTIRKRLFYIILLPLILLSSLFWNEPRTPLNNFLVTLGDNPVFYNQLTGVRINGPIIQYLNNVDVTVMKRPEGYSANSIKNIVTEYRKNARTINRQRNNKLGDQTVIFNLSESLANPNRVPGVRLKNNPIPFITKMAKNNTGGIMISSGYGGGTANMEYMTLTGYSISNFSPTLPTPYTQLVPTLKDNPSIVDDFKNTVAIHPYVGNFYNRVTVYQKFGFNRFLYLGSKYKIKHQEKIDRSPYLSDKTAYVNTLDQIRGNHSSGLFINLVTMQNHWPFDKHFYNNNKRYSAQKVSTGTSMSEVNDYATGINYTDGYVKKFINQIDNINKPITIVFYGDHLPGIYANNMQKDGLKLHETDYFIYSNRYARNHGAKNITTNTRIVTPNDFIAMVAKQTNSKVNWYQALLTAVYEKLPAITLNTSSSSANVYNSGGTEFVNQDAKIIKKKDLSNKQRKILHDYTLIQYDITAGKHYALKYLKH